MACSDGKNWPLQANSTSADCGRSTLSWPRLCDFWPGLNSAACGFQAKLASGKFGTPSEVGALEPCHGIPEPSESFCLSQGGLSFIDLTQTCRSRRLFLCDALELGHLQVFVAHGRLQLLIAELRFLQQLL